MHAISGRYHKPKSRPSKKKLQCLSKLQKRWSSGKTDVSANDNELENSEISIEHATKNNIVDLPVEAGTSFAVSKFDQAASTTSERKLNVSFENILHPEKLQENASYVFMNSGMWSDLLCNVKCDVCCNNSLDVISKGAYGYASKIQLICRECDKVFSSIFSSPRASENEKCFDANKKLVEAFLKIGKGHAAIEVFSMAIGIHAMDKKTFSKCLRSLYTERQTFKNDILQVARNVVRKKHEEFDSVADQDILDITVSYDGTWQKRGHTSLYGIGLVIDIMTGLVIDYEILSKYCPECVTAKRDLGEGTAEFSIWFSGHKCDCSQNYTGSSNAMEMAAAEVIWKRSINNCGMRYISMLSDGDAKTYQHLVEMNVYGRGVKITKEECINHVAKRLGTGLRNKVKEWRSKGITIGGRKEGSLKEDTIVKLTNFYRKAIKDNVPDLEKMKTAIYATLFHCSSTDESPKHSKCPTGVASWCFYQRALACKEKPKSHKLMKTKLSQDVLCKILPIYQRLASNELLARCISGKTQNANESVHGKIWNNCSKEVFISKKRLEMSVISSISEFNFGCLNTLGFEQEEANSLSLSIAERRDKRRVNQSKKRCTTEWKKCRNSKKICKSQKNNQTAKKEGETYHAGGF